MDTFAEYDGERRMMLDKFKVWTVRVELLSLTVLEV